MSSGLVWYEKPFYWLGLTTPGIRFLATFTLANAAIFALKPRWAFTDKGAVKSWSVNTYDARTPTTMVPWWLPPLVIASASSIFI
jgi:hypothetical protein